MACTASQWTRAPWAWAIRAASATGWMTPVSLLASMSADQRRPIVGRQHVAPALPDRRRPLGVDRNDLCLSHRLQHRIMFDRRDQDALAAAAADGARSLASVAPLVKTMCRRCGADRRRHLFARILDQAPRGAAMALDRGGIAAHAPAPTRQPLPPRGGSARWRCNPCRRRVVMRVLVYSAAAAGLTRRLRLRVRVRDALRPIQHGAWRRARGDCRHRPARRNSGTRESDCPALPTDRGSGTGSCSPGSRRKSRSCSGSPGSARPPRGWHPRRASRRPARARR